VCSSDLAGVREHFFYVTDPTRVDVALAAAESALAGYTLERQLVEDPEWAAYRDELAPTPRARAWMADRRTVDALARQGDRAATPRPVDHYAYFPSAAARDAFAAETAAQGFTERSRRDDAPPPNGHGVRLLRTDPVTLRHVHGVAWSLRELAVRHGGEYDGWESAVETREPPPLARA
jgi:hypothetical protein